MNTIRSFNRRWVGYAMLAFVMTLAMAVPALVSADQVTERSIAVSSSSAGVKGVMYQVKFTPATNAGAFVIDFCSNSPVVGQVCDAPAGFSAAGAESSTTGFTDVTPGTNKVIVTGAITASTPVSVDLTGINNPSKAEPLYARIVTFDSKTDAQAYTSTLPGENVRDQGGVAISITPTVGVSGAVLESLTFCVAKDAIDPNCANLDDPTKAPVLKLGEQVGDTIALVPGQLSKGSLYTQISTNAANGVVVRLKSNATGCGGLLRAGAGQGVCDILPALNNGIDENANEAKFGIKTADATGNGVNPNGTLQPAAGSFYNKTTYALNYVNGDATGITSTFGDAFLDTNGKPASNQNMKLTFGATVSNNTPAGLYSADLSMIAVGKF